MGRRKGDKGAANGANGRRRANNTGTLEKRGEKWLARWYVYTPQGKRLRKSQMIAAGNIDEARAKLRDLTEGNALMSAEKDLKRDMERLQGVKAEIQRFEFIIGVQYSYPNNCSVVSFKGKTYINMIRSIQESELERLVFSRLVEVGIPVEIESNMRGRDAQV